MRHIFALALVVSCGSGCAGITGDHAHHGWFVGAWKPSSVDQQGVTLINQTAGQMGASPMGTLSGPISEANSTHAPVIPVPALPPSQPLPPRVNTRYMPIACQPCDPCPPAAALTFDQWQKLQGMMKAQQMPRGEE